MKKPTWHHWRRFGALYFLCILISATMGKGIAWLNDTFAYQETAPAALAGTAPAIPGMETLAAQHVEKTAPSAKKEKKAAKKAAKTQKPVPVAAHQANESRKNLRDSIVAFARHHLGTRYVFGGKNPITGFDCSGFTAYVFRKFGIGLPPSSALLDTIGTAVPRGKARPGDLIVFTGTNRKVRRPGHAGIVVSEPGETPLRFIHASSGKAMAVTENTLDDGFYDERFLTVRRVAE